MTEEELNEMFIRDKLHGVCQDCLYLETVVPIIRKMIKNAYVDGLEQGKFDSAMEYDHQINEALDALKVLSLHLHELRPSNLNVIEKQINKINKILKGSENNE